MPVRLARQRLASVADDICNSPLHCDCASDHTCAYTFTSLEGELIIEPSNMQTKRNSKNQATLLCKNQKVMPHRASHHSNASLLLLGSKVAAVGDGEAI